MFKETNNLLLNNIIIIKLLFKRNTNFEIIKTLKFGQISC